MTLWFKQKTVSILLASSRYIPHLLPLLLHCFTLHINLEGPKMHLLRNSAVSAFVALSGNALCR